MQVFPTNFGNFSVRKVGAVVFERVQGSNRRPGEFISKNEGFLVTLRDFGSTPETEALRTKIRTQLF
jgi:hypothetical protein